MNDNQSQRLSITPPDSTSVIKQTGRGVRAALIYDQTVAELKGSSIMWSWTLALGMINGGLILQRGACMCVTNHNLYISQPYPVVMDILEDGHTKIEWNCTRQPLHITEQVTASNTQPIQGFRPSWINAYT